ncbi:BatD family protein [Marinibaculum pumilum]|uniref:BatD family protein n=1 Tax=Marinibaculum pumilum TaxID=1766165 RepID=A0ABV7L5Q2_9PROT
MASADRNHGPRSILFAAVLVPALGLGLLAQPALADSLQSALSRDQVRVGETVELLLRYRPDDASAGAPAPDLAPLERDFRILDTRQSQRTMIVNGRRDASLDWVVTLTPRHAGAATVPALQVGDASSEALPLQVAAAPTPQERAAAADLPDLFLEAEVDRSDPYVQGQTVLTARIHDAAGMTAAALTDPQIPGAVVERLGEDRVYRERRGDRDYRVIERRFAIFPQASGRLEIPPLRLEAQVPAADVGGFDRAGFGARFPFARGGGADPFADMFARMRQMGFGSDPFGSMFGQRRQVLSQPLVLEVRERPASATADWFLPAEDVRLVEDWSADSFTAGTPVTRTVTLMAKGLTGAQLPDLVLPDAPGVKQYVEDDGRQTVTRGDGTLTARQTTVAVVPSRAGTVALPEIRVAWWDVAAEQQREAVLPARTLQVAAMPGSGSTAPAAVAAGPVDAARATDAPETASPGGAGQGRFSTSAWLPDRGTGLAAGAGLLLLGAGGFLALRRRRNAALAARKGAPVSGIRAAAGREDLARAETSLAQACAAGTAAAALDALAQWGRARWPENPPRGAAAVAARLQAKALEQAVRAVTRRLYGDARSEPGWQPPAAELVALHDAFRAARSRVGVRNWGRDEGRSAGPLPDLYPSPGGSA